MAVSLYEEWLEAISYTPEFKDDYTRPTVARATSGLYLMEQCAMDPHTKQVYYWVKVGQSKDIKKRLTTYETSNPAYFLLDIIEFDEDDINTAERDCQLQLMNKAFARGRGCKEWFLVDEETFFEIEAKKFDYFFS